MILFMNCSSVEEPDILKSGESSDQSSSSSLPDGQVLCYAVQHNICSVMPEKSCSVLEGLPVATCPGDAPSAGVSSSSGKDSPSSSQIPFWRIYTDQEDVNAIIKGTSTVQNARNADGKYTVFLPDDGETVAKLQNYVLGGKLQNSIGATYDPFAGLSMNMDGNVEYYNLFNCQNGFAYDFKGAAHKFQVLISAVSDYDFHAKNILYSSFASSWETVTVLFSELKQEGWGTKVSFNIGQILEIEWQVRGNISTETGNLAVKNLRCAN